MLPPLVVARSNTRVAAKRPTVSYLGWPPVPRRRRPHVHQRTLEAGATLLPLVGDPPSGRVMGGSMQNSPIGGRCLAPCPASMGCSSRSGSAAGFHDGAGGGDRGRRYHRRLTDLLCRVRPNAFPIASPEGVRLPPACRGRRPSSPSRMRVPMGSVAPPRSDRPACLSRSCPGDRRSRSAWRRRWWPSAARPSA